MMTLLMFWTLYWGRAALSLTGDIAILRFSFAFCVSMSVTGMLRQLPRDTCDPKPCVRIERRVGDAIEYEVVIANPMQVISCIHIG